MNRPGPAVVELDAVAQRAAAELRAAAARSASAARRRVPRPAPAAAPCAAIHSPSTARSCSSPSISPSRSARFRQPLQPARLLSGAAPACREPRGALARGRRRALQSFGGVAEILDPLTPLVHRAHVPAALARCAAEPPAPLAVDPREAVLDRADPRCVGELPGGGAIAEQPQLVAHAQPVCGFEHLPLASLALRGELLPEPHDARLAGQPLGGRAARQVERAAASPRCRGRSRAALPRRAACPPRARTRGRRAALRAAGRSCAAA